MALQRVKVRGQNCKEYTKTFCVSKHIFFLPLIIKKMALSGRDIFRFLLTFCKFVNA